MVARQIRTCSFQGPVKLVCAMCLRRALRVSSLSYRPEYKLFSWIIDKRNEFWFWKHPAQAGCLYLQSNSHPLPPPHTSELDLLIFAKDDVSHPGCFYESDYYFISEIDEGEINQTWLNGIRGKSGRWFQIYEFSYFTNRQFEHYLLIINLSPNSEFDGECKLIIVVHSEIF